MSIETYVYAIAGVYCKDVMLSKEKTKVRGCDHHFIVRLSGADNVGRKSRRNSQFD